ncbi:MAG: HAMP domain-containing histidine kinase [Mariniphaga sp.]|nr:HAMP domain-containing histidine kinase [Mariniphaga sp.]
MVLLESYQQYDKETIQSILIDLKQSGENAYILLENLLNWSRSQRGTIEFNPVETNVSEMFGMVLPQVSSSAKKKNIQIIEKIPQTGVPIFADINMLSLVCRNLLTNAIKFSNHGSKVWFEVNDDENDVVTISISDQGIGIELDKIKSLFNFGENTATEGTAGEKGTGLGLILCKEFVSKHKGEIWVESEPGKGSTFFFNIHKHK